MSANTPETTQAPAEQPEHLSEPAPGFHCESCDRYLEEEGETPLYECGDDGIFASEEGNRCPQCNKFGTRVGYACPECDEGPVEDAVVFHCERCDAWFEDGDQEDHQHEDDDEDDPEAQAAKAHARSVFATPLLATKPATDVAEGDLVAVPWPEGSEGADKARRGVGVPFSYREVERVDVRDDWVHVWTGHVGQPLAPVGNDVQVVTGWGRPPGAYEIAARDMRLDHIVLTNPDDWTKRNGYREVTHDLVTGTVTCGQRSRRSEPVEYQPDQVLTVVGEPGKRDLIGTRAWRVAWDRSFASPLRSGADGGVEHNPDYDAEEPLRKALAEAGIVEGGRKLYLGRNSMTVVNKRPDLAHTMIDLLREHGFTPTSLTEFEQTKYR